MDSNFSGFLLSQHWIKSIGDDPYTGPSGTRYKDIAINKLKLVYLAFLLK